MDYVGLSWVEFVPLLITVGLFIGAYFVFKEEFKRMRDYGDYFLMFFLFVIGSLIVAIPLLVSLCFGCLIPNSPDDAQCAAVINASKYVIFIERGEKTPKTKALIISSSEDPGFSVWKDGTMLFDRSTNRRRSCKACRLVRRRGQKTHNKEKRQEIIEALRAEK